MIASIFLKYNHIVMDFDIKKIAISLPALFVATAITCWLFVLLFDSSTSLAEHLFFLPSIIIVECVYWGGVIWIFHAQTTTVTAKRTAKVVALSLITVVFSIYITL
jgi:hypothetical protein